VSSGQQERSPRSALPDEPSDPALPAVRTTGLSRRFGKQLAVDEVALSVPRGSVYGFLGPNGSGKTTTIRMLLGLLNPHAGSIELLGRPMPQALAAVLPRVGALIEGPAFQPYLTGAANLRRLDHSDATAAPATSDERIAAALARVGLTAAAGKRYRNYSLGMKQRLGIAAALLQPRELLVLDEPTNGLDPQGTREVRNLIRNLADEGITVLVSSHLLAEIEQIASHVGIMSNGRLLRQGSLREVLSDGAALIRVTTPDVADTVRLLNNLELLDVTEDVRTGSVTGRLGDLEPDRIAAVLVNAGVRLRGLGVERPHLEELFVSLTGEGFDVLR